MNDNVARRSGISVTTAITAFAAALIKDETQWPDHKESFLVVWGSDPTFSFVKSKMDATPTSSSHEFAREIASVFASLSEGQEPLGVEFEAEWDANVDSLYQS